MSVSLTAVTSSHTDSESSCARRCKCRPKYDADGNLEAACENCSQARVQCTYEHASRKRYVGGLCPALVSQLTALCNSGPPKGLVGILPPRFAQLLT